MSLSPLRPSSKEIITLWNNDPRKTECQNLNEESLKSRRNGDYNSEACKEYSRWNPIPKVSDTELSELKKRVHPALVKDHTLVRINDEALDIFGTSFIWNPKIGEKLHDVNLKCRFITLHENGYPALFKPSISEVLSQLPKVIIESPNVSFFTTQLISDNVYECTVGSNRGFHVAVTSVFSA